MDQKQDHLVVFISSGASNAHHMTTMRVMEYGRVVVDEKGTFLGYPVESIGFGGTVDGRSRHERRRIAAVNRKKRTRTLVELSVGQSNGYWFD